VLFANIGGFKDRALRIFTRVRYFVPVAGNKPYFSGRTRCKNTTRRRLKLINPYVSQQAEMPVSMGYSQNFSHVYLL
jgi:hypothetical protein